MCFFLFQYEFPWGKETIEEVTIRRLRNVNERYAADSNPSLEFIECVTTAEQGEINAEMPHKDIIRCFVEHCVPKRFK